MTLRRRLLTFCTIFLLALLAFVVGPASAADNVIAPTPSAHYFESATIGQPSGQPSGILAATAVETDRSSDAPDLMASASPPLTRNRKAFNVFCSLYESRIRLIPSNGYGTFSGYERHGHSGSL